MINWTLVFVFAAVFSTGVNAQVQPFQDANNKWGLKNNGTIVLQPQYDYINDFSEGLSTVLSGVNFGIIDTSGKVVVAPGKYNYIYGFSEGMAAVRLDGKSGFIDKSGREVIAPKYSYSGNFHEGFAPAELNGKMGFIDKTGKTVIPFQYGFCTEFQEGLASVAVGGSWDYDLYIGGKWGVIDKTGKEIIAPKYDYVGPFNAGVAEVNIGGKWNYDDNEMPMIFDGMWGAIDRTGKEIVTVMNSHVYTSTLSQYGYMLISLGSKYGIADASGKMLTKIKYDFVRPSSEEKEIAVVNIGGKYDELYGSLAFNPYVGGNQGFINFRTGKELTPVQYAFVGDFSEGLAMVNSGATYSDELGYRGGKCGYIDTAGKTIIPLQFDSADYFIGGKAKVSQGGREYYIDKTGREIK